MSPNRYRPNSDAALILSPDALASALLGAMVELVGVRPVFARADETPKAALRRTRPMSVLMSHDEPAVRDDAFMGPAMMTGARLFAFGTAHQLNAVHDLTARYRLDMIVIPLDLDTLRERLTAATESSRHPPGTTAP